MIVRLETSLVAIHGRASAEVALVKQFVKVTFDWDPLN